LSTRSFGIVQGTVIDPGRTFEEALTSSVSSAVELILTAEDAEDAEEQ